MSRDDPDDIDRDPDAAYRHRRRWRDPDDDPANLDRDVDAAYRRRHRDYELDPDDPELAEEERRAEAGIESARRRMRWPGLGLALAGLVGVVGNVWHLIDTQPFGKAGITVVVWVMYALVPLGLGLLFAALTLVGGICFAAGRYRGLAVTGLVLGCFPLHWGMPLAVPFAVWGFILLSDPDVQRRFDRR